MRKTRTLWCVLAKWHRRSSRHYPTESCCYIQELPAFPSTDLRAGARWARAVQQLPQWPNSQPLPRIFPFSLWLWQDLRVLRFCYGKGIPKPYNTSRLQITCFYKGLWNSFREKSYDSFILVLKPFFYHTRTNDLLAEPSFLWLFLSAGTLLLPFNGTRFFWNSRIPVNIDYFPLAMFLTLVYGVFICAMLSNYFRAFYFVSVLRFFFLDAGSVMGFKSF